MDIVTYCRMCGGNDRTHEIVPCDYPTDTDVARCSDCGTEKTVLHRPLSPTLERAELIRTFEYRADIHVRCVDDYLHSDAPQYSELSPGFREDMCKRHIASARKYLELAEVVKTGIFDTWLPSAGITVPSTSETLLEIERAEAECRSM